MLDQTESKIGSLRQIKIRNEFKDSLRQDLMKRVALNKPERVGEVLNFSHLFSSRLSQGFGGLVETLKHAYVPVTLAVFILLGSSVMAMKVAGDSLPGEFLYGVKRVSEKAQVGLTLSQTNKVRKEVDFAEKRIYELAVLTSTELNKVGSEEKGENSNISNKSNISNSVSTESEVIAKAVQNFHKEITNVKDRLDSLEERNDEKAVETAKVVEQKTGQFADALTQVAQKEDLPEEVKERIITAIYALNDISRQALGVVLKEQIDVEGEEMGMLVERLEDKILDIEERIANVDVIVTGKGLVGDRQGVLLSVTKKVELAKVILNEARECLNNRNLEAALKKMEESKEIAEAVGEELAQENEIEIEGIVDQDEAGNIENKVDDDSNISNDSNVSNDGEGELQEDGELMIEDRDIDGDMEEVEDEMEGNKEDKNNELEASMEEEDEIGDGGEEEG